MKCELCNLGVSPDDYQAHMELHHIDIDLLARHICHAVEQRSDDCDMEMHARVKSALLGQLPNTRESQHTP